MADTTKPKVLIVDDVEANLISVEAALEGVSCELVRASSGNEALRQLLRSEFAVILLDVQMPGMDGYEVAKYARDNPNTREVPIIFLTAMHQTEDGMLRGYGTGAVDFLFKPINVDILRGKVRVFLELYMARSKLEKEVVAHEKTLASLKQVNAALHHFTNAASHDLRAPVRAMQGFLRALDERIGETLDEESRDYLMRSRRASMRMDSLLQSLLSYARLQKPAELSHVRCQPLVEQIKGDLAETLAAASATLTVDDLPVVAGDADRLYQLFVNLISNALKFRRADVPPIVRVSSTQQGSNWLFCVEDNGIGVSPAFKSSIFEAFQRLHPQSEYEGSGLGLMICRQIVEQHGGEIWLESAPGAGCKFYFTLRAVPKE